MSPSKVFVIIVSVEITNIYNKYGNSNNKVGMCIPDRNTQNIFMNSFQRAFRCRIDHSFKESCDTSKLIHTISEEILN